MRAMIVGTMLLLATDLFGQTVPQLDLSYERGVIKKAGIGSDETALLAFFKERKASQTEQPVAIAAARLLADLRTGSSASVLPAANHGDLSNSV